MISLAQQFLDRQWPKEWPEYDGEGVAFYDNILKEWEQEYKAAIYDRWIDFKKQTDLQREIRALEQESADARREAMANR